MNSAVGKIVKGILITILVLIIIVSIPYFINHLVLRGHLPCDPSIAGDNDLERSWLAFWSNYLGCIISSIITFVVLYLTLRQNNEQSRQNREDAHNENTMLREYQDKKFQYERAMTHVSDIRMAAVSMYHSLVNEKSDEIYSIITLDKNEEIDFKHIRALLLSVLDENKRSYIELQMLLSYDGTRNDKTEQLMEVIKKMSDESYQCIQDLVHLFILCRHSSETSRESIKSNIYKNSADNKERIKLPNYKLIWDIIIDEDLFDIKKNRPAIALKWHDEWTKVNDLYLVSLRGLVNHYFMEAQALIA